MTNPIFYKRISGSEIPGDADSTIEPYGTLVITNGNELRLHDGFATGGNLIAGGGSATTSSLVSGNYSISLSSSTGVLTLSTASTILGSGTDPNVYIETFAETTSTWTFGTDGNLTLPIGGTIKGSGTGTDVVIVATNTSTTSTWTFSATGTLTFPNGSIIGSDNGYSGIPMTTQRGTVLFGNRPEAVITSPNHFHIMKDDPTNVDLFFGDDYAYVQLPRTGGVNINTYNTMPDSVISVDYSSGGWNTGSYTNVSTTGGHGTGMIVNAVAGNGDGYINSVTIVNPGIGYLNGDSISIIGEGTATFTVGVTGNNWNWAFGVDGKLTFPNGSKQTTAYSTVYTGWFQPAETVVQLDTLLARVSSTGTMQISTTIIETPITGAAFAWNGIRNKGATMSSFGQGGTNWVMPNNWLDISATPLDNDFEVATVSVFKLGGTGNLYRINYVGATNSKWSVVIERMAIGSN